MLKKIICCISVFALLLTGCSKQTDLPKQEETTEIKLVDQAGRDVVLEKPAEKVVSCYYVTTYAMMALGLEDNLVGIESKADKRAIYKMAAPELIDLPSVGTLKEFNVEAAAALQPDLVIMPKKLMDHAQTLEDLGIPVLVVYPESEELLEEMLGLIGKAMNKEEKAEQLLSYYKDVRTELEEELKEETAPSVYMAGNSSYLTTAPADMYQNTMIERAKGVNAAASIKGDYWTEVSYEDILVMNPDVILLPSMAEYSVEDVINDPQLQEVTAIKNQAVYQMPKNLEEWDSPIPSGILGVYWTASVLHETAIPFEKVQQKAKEFYQTFYGFSFDETLVTK